MQRALEASSILIFVALAPLVAQDAPVRRPPPADRGAQMQAIVLALGVSCNFCHSAQRGSGQPEPKKSIARAMMDMTDDINARLQAATGKAAGVVTEIQCASCHRGVTIPKPITDIVWQTTREQNVAAAAEQYRDLRKRYYGRSTYDFSEEPLATLAQRIANVRPDDAIALMRLNLEFYPQSVNSYVALAYAQTRKLDDAAAIASLEKALELEPGNGVIEGRLEQLKSYHRPR
jgi:Photosynthetic reaction centre cytochrome C subunit